MDQTLVKCTLSTGKVVLLREPRIEFQALASQRIGGKAGDDKFTYVLMLNKEMLRLMIHSINEKPVDQKALLDLDAHLSYLEFNQLSTVIGKLTGGEDPLAVATTETVLSGAK
jgi:hypothetical protein